MGSGKYMYNPEKMTFEKQSISFRKKIFNAIPFITLTLFFAAGSLYVYDHHFESPKLKRLKEEQVSTALKLQLMKGNVDRLYEKIGNLEYNDDNIYRTYFEVNPLPATTRDAGFGGNDYYERFGGTPYSGILTDLAQDLDILAGKAVVQSRSYDEVIRMARNKEKRLSARPAIQPVSIKELTRFGSAFGMRLHPILKTRRMHEGIDLTAPRGTKIFATADGVVLEAHLTGGGYGNKIVIDHGYGYRTLYGHLYKILVEPGQRVKRGDIIGLVGSTGLSTCPHLHYEVHVNGRAVNPVNYYANDLTAQEYDHMIGLLSEADPGFDIN